MPIGRAKRNTHDPAWDQHHDEIVHLYIESQKSLREVMDFMARNRGFSRNASQYQRYFAEQGIQKNITEEEWRAIAKIVRAREATGKRSLVYQRGRLLDASKVQKGISRGRHSPPFSRFSNRPLPPLPQGYAVLSPASECSYETRIEDLPFMKFRESLHEHLHAQSLYASSIFANASLAPYPDMVICHHKIILPELKSLLPSAALQPYMIELSTAAPVQQLSMAYMDLLSFSVANNFAGLDGLPIDAAFSYLRHQSGAQFSHLMQSMEGLTARALSQKLFVSAIEAKDARAVDMILRCRRVTGVDPNTAICHVDGYRYTPIERSAELHDFQSTKVLLGYQADVNKTFSRMTRDPRGALSRSIARVPFDREQVSLELVRLLLRHGATVRAEILRSAIQNGTEEVVEALFTAGLHGNHKELGDSGIFGELISSMSHDTCIGIVGQIVDIGADINAPYFLSRSRMLDMAAKKGDFELVRTLLNSGALMNDATLVYAIQSKNADLAMFLIEKGAKIDGLSYDDPQSTPLAEAIRVGKPELVQALEAQSALHHIRKEAQYVPVLVAASAVGNIEMVQRLLQIQTNLGLSKALIEATKANHEEIATLLIGVGATMNSALNGHYASPLASALRNRNPRIVRAILNADPELNDSDLSLAAEWGDISIIEDLLVAGCPIRHGAMSTAIRRKDQRLIERFIEAGADLNGHEIYHETALVTAVKIGDTGIVSYLLLHGADPGDPELLLPAMEGDSEMFDLLHRAFLQRYPHGKKGYCDLALKDAIVNDDLSKLTRLQSIIALDLSKRNGALSECLALAVKTGNAASIKVVRMLLEAGADPNGAFSRGSSFYRLDIIYPRMSVLQIAIEAKRIRMAEILLDAGAAVNFPATRRFKRTPIQAAAQSGCYEMVQMLIRRGANVNAPAADRGGGTAIQLASIGGYIGIVELLLKRGADVNRAPSVVDGRTALEGAAEHGRLDMVFFLLRSGFQITGQDGHQRLLNAVRMAEENGHFVVAEALKSHLPQLQ